MYQEMRAKYKNLPASVTISNDDFLPVIRSDLLSRLQVMQGYDTSYLAKSWMCCIPKKSMDIAIDKKN